VSAIKSFMQPPSGSASNNSTTPVTQQAAIGAYEAERVARSGEEVRLSEINTRMLHKLGEDTGELLFKSGMQASGK
jgi:hypothetical protein